MKTQNTFEHQTIYIEKVRDLLYERYKGATLLAHVHTFGCQQNVSDGEKIKGLLALMGYTFSDTPEHAQLVLYNTCAVRENAEDRVFGTVGQLKRRKRETPDMIIGLCGCMMQQEHIAQKIKQSYPYVDLVFGTHVIERLPEMLYGILTDGKRHFDITQGNREIIEHIPVLRDSSSPKASLPIMYGCDNFCTYCVVPYVRGRERSRNPAEIVAEFRSLIEQGYKDITLLGQNVNSYGKGLEEGIDFPALLRKLNAIDGDFRIRFMSSHPKDASFALIDTMTECEKVCKYFHLPVQHGSDEILKRMNRSYTTQDYCTLIDYAREKMPDISFSSDIIIGFPGETEQDFQKTLDLLKRIRFDFIYAFIYSKRVGTKAAELPDPTPYSEKSRRFTELLAVQRAIGEEKYKSCVGQEYRVLVDGKGRSDPALMTGRNDANMIVDFKGSEDLLGQYVTVRIHQSLGWALIGEITANT